MACIAPDSLRALQEFCARPVMQTGTKPLKKGTELAVFVDGNGPITLKRSDEGTVLLEQAPKKPDLTLEIPAGGVEDLVADRTEDIGEIGITILKLMSHTDPAKHIKVKVHIGLIEFVFHGYLGILPLGGPTVMKFLASKGFTSISKIREAISNLRG